MATTSRTVPPTSDGRGTADADPALQRLLLDIEARRARARRRLLAAELEARARAGSAPPNPPVADARPTATQNTGDRDAADVPAGEPGTVLSVRRVADDLISFRLARPAGFDYAPGNSVKLAVDNVSRSYSMVSAPHERDLEFFIELLPGGRMAAKLQGLREGQRIGVGDKAKGGLTLDGKARRHLMLATVTGVNPFVSLLRDAVYRGLRDLNCILVHGASYADEFGYSEELEALAASRPDLLRYIRTVSRPDEARNATWQRSTGRANSLITPVLQKYGLSPDDTAAYACGNPGMVNTARGQLEEAGFRVHTEKYS